MLEWLHKSDPDSGSEEEQHRLHTLAAGSFRFHCGRRSFPIQERRCVSLYASACDGDMTASALIGTGAMLALLDRVIALCVEVFRQLRLPLLTSEAVLTELFHLVGDSRHEMEAAWQLVNSGVIVLAPIDHRNSSPFRIDDEV